MVVTVALDRSLRDPSLFVPVLEDAYKSKVSCYSVFRYHVTRYERERGNERNKAYVISLCRVWVSHMGVSIGGLLLLLLLCRPSGCEQVADVLVPRIHSMCQRGVTVLPSCHIISCHVISCYIRLGDIGLD